MRRLVLLLLLFVLPVQFATAGALNCCQAKGSAGPHHAVRAAETERPSPVGAEQAGGEQKSPAGDRSQCECAACHLVAAQPAASGAMTHPGIARDRYTTAPQQDFMVAFARRVDKPNWHSAVQAGAAPILFLSS